MMTILNYFPQTAKINTPRPQQIEVLEWFEQKLSEGKRKFIICAPTGAGKSGIAKGIANLAASKGLPTLITSPLNTLVDQYKEFEGDHKFPLLSLTGKKHYECAAMRSIKGEKVSCDSGFCAAGICTMSYKEAMDSRSKLKMFDERECDNCSRPDAEACPCKYCSYKQAFGAFKKNMIGNSNFTLLQMGVTNSPEVVIVDECDYMEPFIRMFRKLVIDDYWHFDNFADYEMCLQDKKEAYTYELESLDKTLENIRHRRGLTDKIDRIERLLTDIKEGNKYIVSDDNGKTTPFEPVSIERFLDEALDTENRIVVLMSATPQKLEGWEFIEVKSPFPKEVRPFKFVPVGSLTMKNRDETIPKLAKMLSEPSDTLLPGKTIVHVPSYSIAERLGSEIYRVSHGKIKPIVQSRESTMASIEGAVLRGDAIDRFKRARNKTQILIAVNMGRGIDLPEADILNNVITYVKRQNPTDHLTRAKWKYQGKEWEYVEAANEVMQQYGRVNRNDKKITNTIITEPEWTAFYRKHREYFRSWFIEAIV
ncbi:MAG: DEAD/DEAH box helicase family protein [Clostridia bacterium]|jgi:hypothetical protein|nr:DEAD/DEAH box helicase family protein [Clostridia bacterium]